jgi:hypothetical protein
MARLQAVRQIVEIQTARVVWTARPSLRSDVAALGETVQEVRKKSGTVYSLLEEGQVNSAICPSLYGKRLD